MPANTTQIFVLKGNTKQARIEAANTASDGSGTLVTLVTAGAAGARVDGVRFRNSQVTAGITAALVHRIFLTDTVVAPHSYRLIGEVATATATRSITAIGATSIFTFDQPIIMLSGQIMAVTQSSYATAADQFDACAFAGDY